MSRALQLDDDLTTALASLVRNGLSLAAAARAMKVQPVSVYEWLAKAEEGDGPEPFATFWFEIGKALGTLEAEAITTVVNAIRRGDVKAAQFLLERRFKDEWGPPGDGKVAVHGDVKVIQIQWPGHDRGPRAANEIAAVIEDAEVVDG